METGKQFGSPVTLIEQTVKANEYQKELMAIKIEAGLGNLAGKPDLLPASLKKVSHKISCRRA